MSVGLLVSILIRIAAFAWSLLLLKRIRDWRMGFLSVMLALMALRQILTLESRFTSTTLTFSSLDTEWPGLIVSMMAFLSVYFLGKMLVESQHADDEQQKLIGELEKQNAELERFTYTISHDLKTPLVTISGFIGYLRRHFDSRDAESFGRDVAKIETAAANMAQNLEELLQLSRIGRVVNSFEKVSLGRLTEEALARLENQIGSNGLELEVASGMREVYVDRLRLVEVMVILIDNAIKYLSRDSAPLIKIAARVQDNEIIYYVSDNGVGIDPRYHEYVFGLFDRLDPDVDGSGIGLTLAKRIIEMHNGRIWVESDGYGSGSTFLFALPLGDNSLPEAA